MFQWMQRLSPRAMRGLVVVLAVLAGLAGYGSWQVWSATPSDMRPEFSLPDLQGEQRHISEWDGEVVVLNFWASWCPPCLNEIPMFVELQDQYNDQGVQFVGVALDRQRQDALEFAQDVDMNYPSMWGMQEATLIRERYGNELGTLPFTVIISREGQIVERFYREVTREQIEPAIQRHL